MAGLDGKLIELSQDFSAVRAGYICKIFASNFRKLRVSCVKSAELASNSAWVRPKKGVWVRCSKSKENNDF